MRRIIFGVAICFIAGSISAQQRFVGMGLSSSSKPVGNYYPIETVYLNTPASVAGIKAGDIIYSVNGISTENKTREEYLAMLKGKEGDVLTITFGGDKKTVQIKLKLIKGKCLSGNCENGDGKVLDPDSSIYTGYFENGKLKGKGKRVLPHGGTVKSVEGNWANGAVEGTGIITYNDGDVLTAVYSDGKRMPGDMKIKFKDGGSFVGRVLENHIISGSLFTSSNVLIGKKEQEFPSLNGVFKFYKQASGNPGAYIYAGDDQGYLQMKYYLRLMARSVSDCSSSMNSLIQNTNFILSTSREFYLSRRYQGDLIDYLENAGFKIGANKFLADNIIKKISEIDAEKGDFKIGFSMDESLVSDIKAFIGVSRSILKMYSDMAPFTKEVGRKQHEFIAKMAEEDKKNRTYTQVQDERTLLKSMADLTDFSKHEAWMKESAADCESRHEKIVAAFRKLDDQVVVLIGH